MIAEPSTGLFHEVGAGKTAEMVMGVMEMKRLGMVNKPAIVVPNHMLDQFTREFKQIYPRAKVLSAGSSDVSQSGGKDARRILVKKAKMGDWDAIIITRSAFVRVGLSPKVEAEFIGELIASERLRLEGLADSRLAKTRVKGREKAIIMLEEKLKRVLDMPRDPGVTFEETGIDYLCVDEAHGYKNLMVASSYEGIGRATGSQLATDLDMKTRWLRGRGHERVLTLATATPMANGLQELYVMQSYLRPDLLKDAGLVNADEWARQFTEEVREVEVGPAGDYRMKTRIAKFKNLPELLTMFHVAGDVKTASMLGLPVPLIRERKDNGQRMPEVVVIPSTVRSKEFQDEIGERAIRIRGRAVDPAVDNMLKLSNDARSAALDMRLFDPEWKPAEGEQTKASVAAERIMEIHKRFEHTIYKDAMGDESPITGGLQLVFADRGTPSDDHFDVYNELRSRLIELGMPPAKIRFMQDANTETDKEQLFQDCRRGDVAVLIGSTEKMGTGTNVQARATAIHHLDCPWRPADVIQREGRVVRQFNQNPEVEVLRYVQAGSFDAFMWAGVRRKGIAAEQIMSGKVTGREIDVISAEVFSFAEAMAMANDDPRIIQRVEMDSRIQQLKRLERGHQREKIAAAGQAHEAELTIERLGRLIPTVELAIGEREDTSGDNFRANLTEKAHTGYGNSDSNISSFRNRAEFGEAYRQAVTRYMAHGNTQGDQIPIWQIRVEVGGIHFKTDQYTQSGTGIKHLSIQMLQPNDDFHTFGQEIRISFNEFKQMAPHLIAQRFENKVNGLTDYREGLAAEKEAATESKEALTRQANRPFEKAEELEDLERRRADLIAEMEKVVRVPSNSADTHTVTEPYQSPEPPTISR